MASRGLGHGEKLHLTHRIFYRAPSLDAFKINWAIRSSGTTGKFLVRLTAQPRKELVEQELDAERGTGAHLQFSSS